MRSRIQLFFQKHRKIIIPAISFCLVSLSPAAHAAMPDSSVTQVTDMLGRTVRIPAKLERIAAMHHFGGKIVYALGQQRKLVEQGLYGDEALAMARVDKDFARKVNILQGHDFNLETLVALRPQCVFVYASFDKSDLAQIEKAGIPVVAVRGETFSESFQAVRLMAKVLHCEDKGEAYIGECQGILDLVKNRLQDVPPQERLNVLFTGPKNIYAVATGEMLQTEILGLAGAVNLAAGLKGFWCDVSPEQVAQWNPDVIFQASLLYAKDIESIYRNPHFATLKAARGRRIYFFPSNIGWWDYPAPHCTLGVLWSAQKLYPERFKDIDMKSVADDFYKKYLGYTFTAMGGKLP